MPTGVARKRLCISISLRRSEAWAAASLCSRDSSASVRLFAGQCRRLLAVARVVRPQLTHEGALVDHDQPAAGGEAGAFRDPVADLRPALGGERAGQGQMAGHPAVAGSEIARHGESIGEREQPPPEQEADEQHPEGEEKRRLRGAAGVSQRGEGGCREEEVERTAAEYDRAASPHRGDVQRHERHRDRPEAGGRRAQAILAQEIKREVGGAGYAGEDEPQVENRRADIFG